MDLCVTYFGKSLNNLEYQDIVNYFAIERTETDQIEFKSFSNLNNDAYKTLIETITGFLNSNGGVLIWGSPVGVKQEGRKEKIFIGDLTLINEVLQKDQTISRCSDSIIPLPKNISVKIITAEGNKCLCVFEIGESEYSPHQCGGKYQMRIDGQTRVAPHHYIEALFKKTRYPNVEGFVRFIRMNPGSNYTAQLDFQIFLFNKSPHLNAENLSISILCPVGRFLDGHEGEIQLNQIASVLHFGHPFLYEGVVLLYNQKMEANEYLIPFVISFGGKNTQAKSSTYMLRYGGGNWNDMETFVVERRENMIYSEKDGVTQEASIIKLLNRNPYSK